MPETRGERLERLYDESAWDLAERVVGLEDEAEAAASVESDRLAALEARDAEVARLTSELHELEGDCIRLSEELEDARTANAELAGYARDAAHWEAVSDRMRGEIMRLTELLQYEHSRANAAIDREEAAEKHAEELEEETRRLRRDLRVSEAKVGGAALYVDQVSARIAMLENVVTAYDGIHGERDRYRLAWLSARRRAADEANFGAEALALRDVEVARLKVELRRVHTFIDEVRQVRGRTMCAETPRDLMESHLRPVYDSLYELEDAERESRAYVPRMGRRAARGEFDDVHEAEEDRRSTDGAPRLECMGSDEDGEVWRLAEGGT
jgi:chromosome segregation ATPase